VSLPFASETYQLFYYIGLQIILIIARDLAVSDSCGRDGRANDRGDGTVSTRHVITALVARTGRAPFEASVRVPSRLETDHRPEHTDETDTTAGRADV